MSSTVLTATTLIFAFFGSPISGENAVFTCGMVSLTQVAVPAQTGVFFSTPDFPATVSHSIDVSSQPCTIEFSAPPGFRLWFALTNARVASPGVMIINEQQGPDAHWWTNVDSNKMPFTFLTSGNKVNFTVMADAIFPLMQYSALQAQVIATQNINTCPNSGNLQLTDAHAPIPIASSFAGLKSGGDASLPSTTCQWSIQVPAGHKLKLAFTHAQFDENSSLTLQSGNNAPIDLRGRLAQIPHVEYFDGTVFSLKFSTGSRKPDVGFFAAVSIVAAAAPAPPTLCTDATTLDLQKGYRNDVSCWLPVPVKAGSETRVRVQHLFAEFADVLQLQTPTGTLLLKEQNVIHFPPQATGVQLQWKPDGSVVQAGFDADVNVIDCTDDSLWKVINCNQTAVVGYPDGYCSHTTRDFTVVMAAACPATSYLEIELQALLRPQTSDRLTIAIENELTHNVIGYNSTPTYTTFTTTQRLFRMQFASDDSLPLGVVSDLNWRWFVRVTVNPGASPVQITLTSDNPAFTFTLNDLKPGQQLQVAVDHGTLDLFEAGFSHANLDTFSLFEGRSAATGTNLGTLDGPAFTGELTGGVPRSASTTKGAFTVQRGYDTPAANDMVLFFRLREAHAANCSSIYNVFQVVPQDAIYSLANSTATGCNSNGTRDPCTCRTTFLTSTMRPRRITFTSLSTTSPAFPGVLVASGDGQTSVPFFYFSHASPNYQNVTMFSTAVDVFALEQDSTVVVARQAADTPYSSSFRVDVQRLEAWSVVVAPGFGGSSPVYPKSFVYQVVTVDYALTSRPRFHFFLEGVHVSATSVLAIRVPGLGELDIRNNVTFDIVGQSQITIISQDLSPDNSDRFVIHFRVVDDLSTSTPSGTTQTINQPGAAGTTSPSWLTLALFSLSLCVGVRRRP